MKDTSSGGGGPGLGAMLAVVGVALAAIAVAVLTWRVVDMAMLNPTVGLVMAGGLMVGLAAMVGGGIAILTGAVDAVGDGAAAYGTSVGHSRAGQMDLINAAASAIEAQGRAAAHTAKAAPPAMPVFGAPVASTNGHGPYEQEEWTG